MVVSLGGLWFAMVTCPGGDAHGHLNWRVDEKPSEEYRFESHGVEAMVKS